jgi:hypothetical protein
MRRQPGGIESGDAFWRNESTCADVSSRRLPEEDGDGSEVEVDEVLGLYESGSDASTQHAQLSTGALPGGWMTDHASRTIQSCMRQRLSVLQQIERSQRLAGAPRPEVLVVFESRHERSDRLTFCQQHNAMSCRTACQTPS